MPSIINTNIASLNAQRNLNGSQSALAMSLQRLSSGLRINSAKDDAAGLAISERFSAQIRGLNQASRNANDGISLAQTAEGALGEVSSTLQRIRELAVQSANATNSASDRGALDAEVQMRVAELNRLASQTEFNGTSLLNGTFTAQAFQVGANQGQTIQVASIASATASALGLNGGNLTRYQTSGSAVTGALAAGDLKLNGADIGAVAGDAKAIATAINNTDERFAATATNAQSIAFTSVQGTAVTPTTLSMGAYTAAVSNGTAASITPATATTITPGAFTSAVSSGSAAIATDITYGAYVAAASGANNATAAATTASGVFTGVTLGAAETYSAAVTTTLGTVNLFTQTNGVVTAADLQQALTTNAAALTAIGVSVAGTVAGNNVILSDAAGNNVTTTIVNGSGVGGFAGASFATGTNVSGTTAGSTAGVLANNGSAFTMTINGLTLKTEAGSVGGTVTAAELDTALGVFLAANTNYHQTSGTFAGNDLRLTNDLGTGITIGITQFAGGTNAVTNGTLAINTTNNAGTAAVAPTGGAFTMQVDGTTIYTEAAATGGTVTAAELDTALNTFITSGAGAGLYTKTGTFAANSLVLSKLDGTDSTLAFSSNFSGTGSTAGAFAGTLASTNGTPAVIVPAVAPTDTAFTLQVDGITLYNEAAAIGGTVTAAELDTAMTGFLAVNTGYSKAGTFAGNNLVLTKADGTDATVAITSNFSGTAGAFVGLPAGTATSTNGTPGTVASANYALTLDGTAVNLTTASADGTISGAEAATAIGAVSGFSASFSGGNLSITKADGSNFTLAETGTLAASKGVAAIGTTYRGSVSLNSSVATTISGNAPGSAGLTSGAAAASSLAYTASNVLTAASANTLLEVVDNALTNVNSSRANLGSIQNRFNSVINSLATTSENLTAARSRILDTDFALETANLTRGQILQQAGTAMLAQANALPNTVLSLLRG